MAKREQETVEFTLPPGITKEQFESALKKLASKTKEAPEPGVISFGEWESGSQLLKVYRDTYKGRELLSIRKFWQDDSGNWQPGKGVTLSYEDIDQIIEGLNQMKIWCEEHPRKE